MLRRFFGLAKSVWHRPGAVRALLRAWRNAPVYPRSLQIEHTNRCNLKCVMCAHGIGKAPGTPDMQFDDFVAVLDAFKGDHAPAEFGDLEAVELQGLGEPFLHRMALPMMREVRQRGLDVFFVSNMTVLTDDMARELVALGNGFIVVSVDSIDPEIFADIRRGAKYDVLTRVLQNIEKIHRIKQEMGTQKPRIIVNSILMRRTIHQAPQLVETLRSIGVAKISFTDLIPYAMESDMLASDGSRCVDQTLLEMPAEEKSAILRSIKALSSPACEVEVPDDWGGVKYKGRDDLVLTCRDLWEKPYVSADGFVTPCCYLPNSGTMPMGNLREQSFKQIWFGKPYQQLRRDHLKGSPPQACKNCPQLVTPVAHQYKKPGPPDTEYYTNVFLGDTPFSHKLHPHPGHPLLTTK